MSDPVRRDDKTANLGVQIGRNLLLYPLALDKSNENRNQPHPIWMRLIL